MKSIGFLLINLVIVFFISCAADKGEETSVCVGPIELTLKNNSDYNIIRLYIHDEPTYSSSTSVYTNLASGQEYVITFPSQVQKYITFIRFITTSSSQEIAISTGEPILFEGCKKYRLHLLEEDFLIENY